MSPDFIRFTDLAAIALEPVFRRAVVLQHAFERRALPQTLAGQRVAFIWDGEGFRNRAAFELGVSLMGGAAVEIPGRLDEREDVGDLARYLDNWFDLVVVRTPDLERLTTLADAARAPVINARTWHNHPCEILGDLAFVRSRRESLDGLRVVFVGEATNLCHSWVEASAALPIHVVQVRPDGFGVAEGAVPTPSTGWAGSFSQTTDLAPAVRDADVIYTDAWPSVTSELSIGAIRDAFEPLRISTTILDAAPPAVEFLPCPPVTRGQEVSAAAMEHPACRVYDAKAWLLPAQAALMEMLVGGEP